MVIIGGLKEEHNTIMPEAGLEPAILGPRSLRHYQRCFCKLFRFEWRNEKKQRNNKTRRKCAKEVSATVAGESVVV